MRRTLFPQQAAGPYTFRPRAGLFDLQFLLLAFGEWQKLSLTNKNTQSLITIKKNKK